MGNKAVAWHNVNDLAFRGLYCFPLSQACRTGRTKCGECQRANCGECLPSCLCPSCHRELHGGGEHLFLCVMHFLYRFCVYALLFIVLLLLCISYSSAVHFHYSVISTSSLCLCQHKGETLICGPVKPLHSLVPTVSHKRVEITLI